MDTKSKNISRSRGMKIAAAALAVVLFFLSGYTAGIFIKGYFLFNAYSDASRFTQTNSFRMLLNNCESTLLHSAELMSCESEEDFLKTTVGSAYSNSIKKANDAFDLLESSGVKVYVTEDNRYRYSYDLGGTTYYFTYNGDVISRYEFEQYNFVGDGIDYSDDTVSTVAASPDEVEAEMETEAAEAVTQATKPNSPQPVANISEALSLLNSYGEYTCYGEISRQDLLGIIRQNEMRSRGVYNENGKFYFYDSLTQNIPGFKYTMYVKTTGKVVSNCGIGLGTAFDEAYAAMAKGAAFIEGSDGAYVTSAKPVENTRGGLLGEWAQELFYREPHIEGRDLNEFDYVIFSYTPTAENTIFTLRETEFDDFNSRNFKNPSVSLAISAVSFLLACAACIYLLCVAGKTADGEVKLCFIDRVPLLINFAVLCGIVTLACVGFAAVFDASDVFYPTIGAGAETYLLQKTILTYSIEFLGVVSAATFGALTAFTASIARNLRCHTFMRHTLIYWIIKPFAYVGKKFFRRIKYICACDYMSGNGKKFKRLAVGLTLAFFLINSIVIWIGVAAESAVPFLIISILDLPVILWVLLVIASLDRIMHGVASVRLGRLDVRIDNGFMPAFLRSFANDITSMQDGLERAVDGAVKDQRMKAELITNVSHDLKTPLTSIVNYVDLLKRCNVEDEDAKKYIGILDEKSQKMKKLIEDLVEASKASSGAVELHPIKIDLCEFAAQAVGEHEDELREKNIELVLNFHAQPVMITADAQKTSRIVENLFSNIRKYALEGTRVYVDVNGGENYGTITFRNISKFPLNIAPEELTQRFVRGDASRSGEGSGLGLSIANDLCELQGGKFNIGIDGDLFKVSIAMPKAI